MWLVYICNSAITPGVRHFAFQQYVGPSASVLKDFEQPMSTKEAE